MKTVMVLSLLAAACGGVIDIPDAEPMTAPPVSAEITDAAPNDDASEAAVDAGSDANEIVCNFPTGVIECGKDFFYCIVPAKNEVLPCTSGCEVGWTCAPTGFDAALGVCK